MCKPTFATLQHNQAEAAPPSVATGGGHRFGTARMKLTKLFFRDTQTTTVDAVESWEVRWYSRYGSYNNDIRPEVRAFPSQEEAHAFKHALEDAFKLIKHTSGTQVTLEKQDLK